MDDNLPTASTPRTPISGGTLTPQLHIMAQGDFKFYWSFEDWEPENCHWRGPSWFGIKADGTIEFGAAYIANMARTDPIFDVGVPRSFGADWELLDDAGSKVWYGGNYLVTGLHYKKFVENTARQWQGGPGYAALVAKATNGNLTQRILADIVPPGDTLPVIDIPWNP